MKIKIKAKMRIILTQLELNQSTWIDSNQWNWNELESIQSLNLIEKSSREVGGAGGVEWKEREEGGGVEGRGGGLWPMKV